MSYVYVALCDSLSKRAEGVKITVGQYRVAQKKVYAFDFVQRKNYKCYVPQINVILSRKA